MLIDNTLREMDILNKKNCDNWLGRVEQIENMLKIPRNLFFNKSLGKRILKCLKSKFEIHFLKKSTSLNHQSVTLKTIINCVHTEPLNRALPGSLTLILLGIETSAAF